MADPRIDDAKFQSNVTVDASATTFLAGDLLAYNGSAWVKADADTPATLFARAICMESVQAGASASYAMPVCMEAMLFDTDAPYTVGASYFLSGTAGAHTATRPTSGLRQVVGVAVSTSSLRMSIKVPMEVSVPFILAETTSAEAAMGSMVALDSGRYEGIQLNANAEYATYLVQLPENCVSVVKTNFRAAAESASSEYAIEVNSAVPSDVSWDTVTADTTVTAGTVAVFTGDDITSYDLVANLALDATNIVRPGALLAIKFIHSNDTDAALFFGGDVICRVV